MAKNHDRGGQTIMSRVANVFSEQNILGNRSNGIAGSIILISLIAIGSFLIPTKWYGPNMNFLLLNIELLILFLRDIVLYFKRSCKLVRTMLILMSTIYVLNIVDLVWNIQHLDYLTVSITTIILFLGFLYWYGNNKK